MTVCVSYVDGRCAASNGPGEFDVTVVTCVESVIDGTLVDYDGVDSLWLEVAELSAYGASVCYGCTDASANNVGT